jgi:hypothetical protein
MEGQGIISENRHLARWMDDYCCPLPHLTVLRGQRAFAVWMKLLDYCNQLPLIALLVELHYILLAASL